MLRQQCFVLAVPESAVSAYIKSDRLDVVGVSSPSVDIEYRSEETTEMTRDEKIIRNKVGVLELAKQLGSVSQACRIMGFSRDSFYRFRDLYEKGR